jgi:hypothetical protein
MNKTIDVIGDPNDYTRMPKFELQQRAILGDKKAERIYLNRYGANKIATLTPEFSIEQDEE